MTTPESRQFFVYPLPALKGTCVLAVVLIHLTASCTGLTRFGWLFQGLLLINSLARFAVPLFVVFSGFYLALNPANERALPFFRRTLKFLLFPYLLYSLLYSALSGTLGSPGRLLRDFLLGSAAPHLWFGLLILQLYLLHPLLRRRYLASRHRSALVLGAFLVQVGWQVSSVTWLPQAATWLGTVLLPGAPSLTEAAARAVPRLGELAFLSHLGYFLGGYLLLDTAEEVRRWLRSPAMVIIAALVWLAAATGIAASWYFPMARGISWEALPHPYLVHFLLTPLLSMAALVVLLPAVQRKSHHPGPLLRGLHAFGLFAYGIYYLHPLFILLVAQWFRLLTGAVPYHSLWFQGLRGAFVAVAAFLTAQLLARLPFGRYLT